MQVDQLLADCAPHLDTVSDQDDYECMDMLAVAAECERPLLLVVVKVFREADLLEAVGIDDESIYRCVVSAGLCMGATCRERDGRRVLSSRGHWLTVPCTYTSLLLRRAASQFHRAGQ